MEAYSPESIGLSEYRKEERKGGIKVWILWTVQHASNPSELTCKGPMKATLIVGKTGRKGTHRTLAFFIVLKQSQGYIR